MNEPLKKHTLTIAGEAYALVSDEAEAVVQAAALEVNALIQQLRATYLSVPAHKIATLAALTYALRVLRSEGVSADCQKRIVSLLRDIDRELITL
jgi:cell division protein ZapA (FtsZ GTPase activity inhibitor)